MKAKWVALVVVLVLLFVFVVTAVVSSKIKSTLAKVPKTKVPKNTILVIDLSREYSEWTAVPFDWWRFSKSITFPELLLRVQRASEDDNVDAILLKSSAGCGLSLSQCWELAQELKKFKAKGKKLYSYSHSFTTGGVYLSSLCDTVFAHPQAVFIIPGFSVGAIFFKKTLAKLGIEFEAIQIGKYKGAADPFVEDSMTVYLRQNLERFVDDYYNYFKTDLAQMLKTQPDMVDSIINSAIFNTKIAKELGIVDSAIFWNDLKKHLVGDKDERLVSISKYARKPKKKAGTIAVVVAKGSISEERDGWSENITAERYAKILRKISEDEKIDAVVFRVESPGGSAIASDEIWNEVVRIAEKKPFIVSMSSIAASGGYYISLAADTIVVTPYTITGSIGVVGLFPNFEKLYDKIGFKIQRINRGKHADILAGDKKMTPEERKILENLMTDFYTEFTAKSARAREMTLEEIDTVAQGRLWVGQSAVQVGLADTIGTLIDAINIARKSAGLPEDKMPELKFYPALESFWEIYFNLLQSSLPKWLVEYLSSVNQAEQLSKQPLYLCPYGVEDNR